MTSTAIPPLSSATDAIAATLSTPSGTTSLDALRHKPVKEVAREFEAMLLAQMIGAMRKTVGDSGLLSASPERKMMDGFFDMELARSLVDQVDLGLARQLTGELERKHGAAEPDGATPVSAADAAADEAALVAPLVARVTSAYGERSDPFTGVPTFHSGLDLAAPRGTPVRAAADGTVTFSGRRGAAGNLVEILHGDGSRTRYAHLEKAAVAVGATVRAGEVLGAVGSSGRSTGPHLHFAVERDGETVDPAALLDAIVG